MKKIVFFGTPAYVLPVVKKLDKALGRVGEGAIEAVVTQPPRASGRTQRLEYSPVDTWAHKKGVPVYHDPRKLIKDGIATEFAVLAAYGSIIPGEIIKHFPKGILNIHPSLLPKYRGASPVQATIVAGEKETGVSVIKLDEKMDHGPIVSSFKEPVSPTDTAESLRERLFEKSGEFLAALIPPFLEGKVRLKAQDHEAATYTTLIRKEHGFIPPKYLKVAIEGKKLGEVWEIGFLKDFVLEVTPVTVERFTRALHPWPGVWTNISLSQNNTKRLKILKVRVREEKLEIMEVQLEGKGVVSWQQFKEGYPKATLV